jgi:uncharacterized CHY-type Zn-finger protein
MCDHQKTQNKIYTKCCDKYYNCGYCHNEDNDHMIKVKNLTKIKCIKCNTEQEVSINVLIVKYFLMIIFVQNANSGVIKNYIIVVIVIYVI